MDNPVITYVIHIGTTREKLWDALTSSEALKENWGLVQSDWKVGSEITQVSISGELYWKGKVLRSEPPHLLSFTFEVTDFPVTEATFNLEPPADGEVPGHPIVRLTLTHAGFESENELFTDCTRGWSEILSSFKTYMETGRPLKFNWKY
jgi:uncharacterized protein YndB with AHSA1/START domain